MAHFQVCHNAYYWLTFKLALSLPTTSTKGYCGVRRIIPLRIHSVVKNTFRRQFYDGKLCRITYWIYWTYHWHWRRWFVSFAHRNRDGDDLITTSEHFRVKVVAKLLGCSISTIRASMKWFWLCLQTHLKWSNGNVTMGTKKWNKAKKKPGDKSVPGLIGGSRWRGFVQSEQKFFGTDSSLSQASRSVAWNIGRAYRRFLTFKQGG